MLSFGMNGNVGGPASGCDHIDIIHLEEGERKRQRAYRHGDSERDYHATLRKRGVYHHLSWQEQKLHQRVAKTEH